MPYEIDETHDPTLESWVASANDPETDFPPQNLPFVSGTDHTTLAVVIGDRVFDVGAFAASAKGREYFAAHESVLGTAGPAGGPRSWFERSVAELGRASPRVRTTVRRLVQDLFRKENPVLRDDPVLRDAVLTPLRSSDLPLAIACRDYTDFYASVHHATNVGSMFRPENPLLPNYKWIPVGYHGRASSVVASGAGVTRPHGQRSPAGEGQPPGFGPCAMLDYELEVGVVIGRENALGRPVPMEHAEEHILGLCLLNDWSARDMQKWEYQPLGPFLAKSFVTSISPAIVTMEALAPFRSPAFARPAGDPEPLPHLTSESDRASGAIDITLDVYLQTAAMRQRGIAPHRLSRGSFKDMYWTVGQMVAHHTSNGCNLQPGDLLGSGTVSGPSRDSRGCLLELTWDGDPWATPPVQAPGTARTPIELPSGETRVFLQDGDEVILRGFCAREGFRRIGFGECRGIVEPATAS